jgi:hypothetical protein
MSSSSAGKFQDHYFVLGVDPKSTSETIQAAYSKLAQKFQPNTPTGDKEQFDAVNHAFEVLSDPMLRREFDKLKGIGEGASMPKFSGIKFFEALGRESGLRSTILSLLYDRRRTKPFTPSISMRHIEGMIAATNEELNFALWYLKKRSLCLPDDKSSLQITVEGMDFLEANRPLPEVVMGFLKPEALAVEEAAPEATSPSPETAPVSPPTSAGESMRNRLTHALARR